MADFITLNSVITEIISGGLIVSLDIDMTGTYSTYSSVVSTINHPVTPAASMTDAQKITIASSYIPAHINDAVDDINTQASTSITSTKVTFTIA